MIARPVPVGARGVDSWMSVSADEAKALKAAGIDFSVRYLGSVTPDEVAGIIAAGLGFMPVTYGNAYDGVAAVARCKTLGLPAGVTVWLDVEGDTAWNMDPATLIAKINSWASSVRATGYQPGLYLGAPQPLTSDELYGLGVVRYWHGQGRAVDRHGQLAEPKCGWCMWQMYPSTKWAGLNADVDIVGQDYEGRAPVWTVAG